VFRIAALQAFQNAFDRLEKRGWGKSKRRTWLEMQRNESDTAPKRESRRGFFSADSSRNHNQTRCIRGIRKRKVPEILNGAKLETGGSIIYFTALSLLAAVSRCPLCAWWMYSFNCMSVAVRSNKRPRKTCLRALSIAVKSQGPKLLEHGKSNLRLSRDETSSPALSAWTASRASVRLRDASQPSQLARSCKPFRLITPKDARAPPSGKIFVS
jgi:hypothetical protein